MVSHQNRHVGRIQPRQRLADRKKVDKCGIRQPPMPGDETRPQVGRNSAAKTGRSNQQKSSEDLVKFYVHGNF